jgi:hypothetical protein
MLRFFEVFPQVSYIYDHTMTPQLYGVFMTKVKQVIKDKTFPTEDLCRVFNILVKISAYSNFDDQATFNEILSRMRHSLYNIPKKQFASTMANLIEFQQPNLASKMSNILLEHPSFPDRLSDEFSSIEERIHLFWSLMQIEKLDGLIKA